MALSWKMVAQEILMCGLRQVPILGPAVEVIDNVQKRYQAIQEEVELAKIRRELSSFDGKLRDLVQQEIQAAVNGLSQSNLSVVDFSNHINNLLSIKANGWSPALFEGLLERSAYWDELCKNPSHYGTILADHQPTDPSKLQVFVDAGNTRILELTPFALQSLLARQRASGSGSRIVASTDVWAFTDSGATTAGASPIGVTQVECPSCHKLLRVKMELAEGRAIKCPICGHVFRQAGTATSTRPTHPPEPTTRSSDPHSDIIQDIIKKVIALEGLLLVRGSNSNSFELSLREDSLRNLRAIIDVCGKLALNKVDIHTNACLDKHIKEISRVKTVKTLLLTGCSKLTDTGIDYISEMVSLERLELPPIAPQITLTGLWGLTGLEHLAVLRLPGAWKYPASTSLREEAEAFKDALRRQCPDIKIKY